MIISIVLSVVAALIFGAYRMLSNDPSEALARDFLGYIESDELDQAYQLGSDRFKATTSDAVWETVAGRMSDRLAGAQIELINKNDQAERSFYEFQVTATTGLIYDFEVHTSEQDGKLLIDYASYSLQTEGSAAEPQPKETEEEDAPV